ncbi:hypothetical protein CU633_00320 [Bacillus sp. V3-13]|uniref:hypothetical protein n=1 Tax=Bacillus sp. V3-13 TaxID=2053728 RepID=UPI000C75B27F|nr:hypothetical protein [Bacillus sp. V3-13]PLR79455.1 hypothetical protein CU633_00320 [Bacillus sp. V3-13]
MNPPYHPDWLVTFWLTTPGLNLVNPHYFLIGLIVLVIGIIYLKKKKSSRNRVDSEEGQFQLLLTKKEIIEKQIEQLELQRKQGDVTLEQYTKTIEEYREHLQGVIRRLHQFT